LPGRGQTEVHTLTGNGLLCLSPIESAIDTSIGEVADKPPLPEVDGGLDPLAALEEAMIAPLERQPCVVSFSGGRDSSVILAVATRVARREGLPVPVPLTYRYPDNPDADESRWQELVIGHLGLSDWQRLSFRDELGLIGPIAQKVLRGHGLISPSGTYTSVPLFEAAAGGSVLTGIDGDGLFGGWDSARAWAVMTGRARPASRDLRRVLRAAAPEAARRVWFHRRRPPEIGWLTPTAHEELRSAWAAERASQPGRWDARVAWFARRRDEEVFHQALQLLADDCQVKIFHPFLDPCFLATVARAGKRSGFGDRTRAMRMLFGELLPPAVVSRSDKADFTTTIWNQPTREFASRWEGGGLPDRLVDEAGLRRAWARPDARSGLLLQAAWLTSVTGKLEHLVNCRFE
jgi:asparagine synthetase B (glutamine-hydrolysing)